MGCHRSMADGEFVRRPYIYLLKRLIVCVNLVHKFSPFSMDMKHLPESCWNDLLSRFWADKVLMVVFIF